MSEKDPPQQSISTKEALARGATIGRYVVLSLPVEEAERLGRPQAPAVYHADPSEHAGASLHDWFGRHFGRSHWKRDE